MDNTILQQVNFVETARQQVFLQQERTVIWPQWQLGVFPSTS